MLPALLKRCLFVTICIFAGFSAHAQLNVNFGQSGVSGCAPYQVNFYNATTGATEAATYFWDFGNGTTSTEMNPSCTFVDAKQYKVTLTVYDCAKTLSKSQVIAVYAPPVIDFTDTVLNKCLPLNVKFNASTKSGESTISYYSWNFGDYQYDNGKQLIHTYNTAFTPQVSLTATTIYGCRTTITKSDFNTNYQPVASAFAVNATNLCAVNSQAVFTNNSSGPGALSYAWDFGDGTTSTQQSPSHAYKNKGSYSVKLTTTSSLGCSNTTQGTSVVNVANFTTDFSVPQAICTGSTFYLADKSTGTPGDTKWELDGQPASPYYDYYHGYGWAFDDTANHTIRLTHTYGQCTVSKTQTVRAYPTPVLDGFIASIASACTTPVVVSFSDTTKGIATWQWFNDYQNTTVPFLTGRNPSYSFTSPQSYSIRLRVTTAYGCIAEHSQIVDVSKPVVAINIQSTDPDPAYIFCNNSAFYFSATPASAIKSYQWSFGDGGTSTAANAKHQYKSEGSFPVTLTYTTNTGCNGKVLAGILIAGKPVSNFTAPTEACVNTNVNFTPVTINPLWTYQWSFGDGSGSGGIQTTHQYNKDGQYTISLITINGICRDTVIKPNYIKINPGTVKVTRAINTCAGGRGEVTFTQTSNQITKWNWDFGDAANTTLTSNADTVRHVYLKSGTYNATLTASNNKCTVKDAVTVNVLVKQSVQIAITPSSPCGSSVSALTMNNIDKNPLEQQGNGYSVFRMVYADSTAAPLPQPAYYLTGNSYKGTIYGLDYRKQGVRMILNSAFFNCFDTSNIVPLKQTKPAAGFAVNNNSVCFKDALVFKDTSAASQSSPIKTLTWQFGDGATVTGSLAGTISHQYTTPGQYFVRLIATDAAGCADTAQNYVSASGPKADFGLSQNPVAINTQVYFYNNTNTFNAYNSVYTWYLPDGTTSANNYESFLFKNLGDYTVKLIATNNNPACADTISRVVKVVKNPAFTYTVSYAGANACPPETVHFMATDVKASQVNWDFGDGARAVNIDSPLHTYTHPGAYKVTFGAYNQSGLYITIADTIVVKGPVGAISADKLAACDSLNVELSAVVKDGHYITWDFGDGSPYANSTDTFYYHMYNKAGVFKPRLIVTDDLGCKDTSLLPCRVVIDDMTASIKTRPPVICDATLANFLVNVKSVAKDQLNEQLQYRWDFGNYSYNTDNPDTASYRFMGVGEHKVNLTIYSPYSCTRTVTGSFMVQPYSRGSITAPSDICKNTTVSFAATATNPADNLVWNWDFDNNTAVQATQVTPPVLYADSGTYRIRLIIDNNGCFDTSYKTLGVHGGPALYITPAKPVVCLGSTVQLSAHNGNAYNWGYPISAVDANSQVQVITPQASGWYTVRAEDAYKCTSGDSVFVRVAAPFKLKGDTTLTICPGKQTLLTVAGADKYTWITGMGLSDAHIPTQTITTSTPQTYTVVGYDNDGCFNDTASIQVNMAPVPTVAVTPHNPTVNAGGDVMLTGAASTGVVSYRWKPADYLSCNNCAAALSTPKKSITYTLTVTNNFGCTAADTTAIKIFCAEDLIHIPNAFTPNNDLKNDRFIISGSGISLIKHIAIFSRFGAKMFERSNVASGDEANSWDGTVNSMPVNPGAYVYIAKIECASGEVFDYKGTIVLIR